MVLKTFALKMDQAKAIIWPWLAHVFQVLSTAVPVSGFKKVQPRHSFTGGCPLKKAPFNTTDHSDTPLVLKLCVPNLHEMPPLVAIPGLNVRSNSALT